MVFSNIESLHDSHFHILEMKKKEMDIENFLSNWEKNLGKYLIDVGTDENNLKERLAYSQNKNYLFHTIGIHPNYCGGNVNDRMKKLEESISNSKIVAIGETGLDYYWDKVDKKTQKDFFVKHIELAIKHNLPVIVHNREACHDILEILKKYEGKVKGIIHCFSSNKSYAAEFIKLGFFLSFAGNVTYKKSNEIVESLLSVPANKILIETDSPYLSPQKVRGKNNHPGYIGYTMDFISSKKEISRDQLCSIINTNFINIFGLRQDS